MTAVSPNERRRLLAADGIIVGDVLIGPGPTSRKGAAEVVRLPATVVCFKCKRRVVGWLAFDSNWSVSDSGGFMDFGKKSQCDACLGERNP